VAKLLKFSGFKGNRIKEHDGDSAVLGFQYAFFGVFNTSEIADIVTLVPFSTGMFIGSNVRGKEMDCHVPSPFCLFPAFSLAFSSLSNPATAAIFNLV